VSRHDPPFSSFTSSSTGTNHRNILLFVQRPEFNIIGSTGV
jgi:hypothetical protein